MCLEGFEDWDKDCQYTTIAVKTRKNRECIDRCSCFSDEWQLNVLKLETQFHQTVVFNRAEAAFTVWTALCGAFTA